MGELAVVFAKGIVIGLSIAAPVGPIGLLCIQRSLNHGALAGLATGMGAALADGVYGMVAAFGLASVSPGSRRSQWEHPTRPNPTWPGSCHRAAPGRRSARCGCQG